VTLVDSVPTKVWWKNDFDDANSIRYQDLRANVIGELTTVICTDVWSVSCDLEVSRFEKINFEDQDYAEVYFYNRIVDRIDISLPEMYEIYDGKFKNFGFNLGYLDLERKASEPTLLEGIVIFESFQ
jgi:hypothetical protein